jgi:pimeloyl-ACP methyl ester carboxylesterase
MSFRLGVLRVVMVTSFVGVPLVGSGVACGGGGLPATADLDGGNVDGGGVEGGALGGGVGDPCNDTDKCRPGLACNNGTCAPGRSSEAGTACVISAECKDGLYCGPMRTCAPAGTGDVNASCQSDGDCKSGLRCNIVGFGAVCQPEGTKDVGDQCTANGECFAGLGCAAGQCAPLPPGPIVPIAVPTWKGVECKDDPGPLTAYFRVPRGNAEDGDFFRLPFPNDVRRDATSGHPTLNGFPTPGSDLLGFDVVDRYVKDVEANADGFSSYSAVVMRFSGEVNFDTLKAQGVVRLIDLSSGNDLGLYWSATTGRGAYVCNNSIAIRPRQGEPYQPGKKYAVFVTTAAKANGGGDIARSADLTALLGASKPATDPALAAAWDKYADLRAWAASKTVSLDTILNATVFTVAKNDAPAKSLATAINGAAAAPAVKSWVKCAAGATSPCPDAAGDRACGAEDSDFDEVHALVTLPIYQKGTAPYQNPPDGDIAYAAGVPQKQRDEDVCMAISVPKGTMPANGWGAVVYAHGTGGSFRSHINEGVAKSLAAQKIAVIGIDQVQHGPRRNGSTASPNDLFFNFTNPGAARGNPLQGAADQLSLVRLARDLDVAANGSVPAIKFDKIAYWGHSQGMTEGAIAMPYAIPEVSGVVLSGAGASLIDALLTKTSPVNIAAAVPFILVDPTGVNSGHPVLGLLQNSIDPSDPLNHGRALTKHAFVPYGQKDTYTPSAVQATYVLAAGLGMAAHAPSVTTPESIGGLTTIAVPASGNLTGPTRTGLTRQYAPAGFDGHFVVFKDATGKKDAIGFLNDLVGATPQTNPRVGVP